MVESIKNEVVVNAEPEHSHGMSESSVGNDVIMGESKVHPNGGEMLVDDAKNKTIDRNMKGEPAERNLCLSEKPLADDEERDGKANLVEITEEFSGFNNASGFVHDEEPIGINTEATGYKDVFVVAIGDVGPISAEEETPDLEIVKNDTLKGNLSDVQHETVIGKSRETVRRNGETQAGTDFTPIHEGSFTLAPVQNNCLTVANADDVHEPTIASSIKNDNVHLVSSSAGNSVRDSGQHQILRNATIASSVSQQTGEFEEWMQPNIGKVQENTNGFTFPDNDVSAPVSCQNVDQSVEVQDHSNDTEMIDSGEVNEEPQEFSEISLSRSEDDDEQIGSQLQEKANDPDNEGNDIHFQEEDSLTDNISLQKKQDVDEEPLTGAEMSLHREKNAKRVALRLGPLAKEYRATYELPPETADQFSVNDLVWGKVKSHPWWPGQIFDPSDSSEKAMKHHRKDCYLVAYFGDKTFAWNEASQLKPFIAHFSQEQKQTSSEAFQNAVDCALEEVSRRVELGLACSCMPEETYDKIKFQIVENAGIQTYSSKREGGDEHISSESFQPDKLVDYVRNLALVPTCGANKVELTVAKAQLLSLYRLKGRQSLPEVQYFEGLENDVDTSLPQVSSLPTESEPADSDSVAADNVSCIVRSKGPKRKHNLKDIVYHRRKEKSFSEIMGESLFYYDEDDDSDEKIDGMLNSPIPSKKRKAPNFLDDEPMLPESSRTISLAKISQTATPSSRQSFKIGDCIRRAASQLTGSSSTIKSTEDGNNEQVGHDIDKSLDIPEDPHNENMVISIVETSPGDFLWELYLTAQDPMRAQGFSKSVVSYFSEFRDAAVSTQRKINEKSSTARGRSGRKRKSSLGVSPEAFEFDDRKDSYWADMVVENDSEPKQPERRTRKRKDYQLGTGDPDWADTAVENNSEAKPPARRSRKRKDHLLGTGDPEKPKKSNQRRNSKKQNVNGNHHELTAEQSSVDEVKQELPTELILNFGDNSVPSVADLNRMFRRFGPLKESETEVDRQNSRARLVYKTGSDAEIAYSSAATFNIFGPITVNYQLGQTPPVSSQSLVPALAHCTEDAA